MIAWDGESQVFASKGTVPCLEDNPKTLPPPMEDLLQAKRAYVSATQSLETLQREERVLEIGALGITGYAPTPALGAKLLTLVNSVTSLDSASNDVHALVDSLSSLHSSAEKSVWRVRRLDEQRRLLQGALERVEDLLDLRACLVGLSSAQASGDRAAIALNVSRFRALSRTLPMPEGDVATVRVAEEALVREVTADFDAAITAQQALTTTTTTTNSATLATATSANGGEQQQQQQHTLALATSRRAAAEATIASCCQLLSLLGRGFVGVERYAAYLRATLSSDIATELRAAAISGVDFPLAALNTVSSLFSKAATALDSAEVLGGALFTSGEASSSLTPSSSSAAAAAASSAGVQVVSAATPAASSNGVVVVHSVVDAAAAKVVLSFTRSGRVAAALAGREAVRSGGGGAQGRQQQREGPGGGSALRNGPTPHLPPHLTNAMLLALESSGSAGVGEDAVLQGPAAYPFALPPIPGGPKPTWEPSGEDFTRPVTLDVFLDELALLLQRCTSYTRLVWARGGKRPAASSSSSAASAAAAAGGGSLGVEDASTASLLLPDVTPALAKFTRLASATAELTGVYTALECAGAVGGLLCAVGLDEVYEDGAAGVSIDLTDPFLPVSLVTAAAAAAAAASSGGGGGGSGEAAAATAITSSGSGSGSSGGEKKEKEEGVNAGAMGGGAMVSSLVEDTFFVLLRAGRRAFASGSADAVATVVNSAIVLTLMDRLGNELDARFRVALGQEEGDKEGGGLGGGVGVGGGGSKPSSSSAGAAGAGGVGAPFGGGGAMGGGGNTGGLGLASPTAPPLTPEQWERLTLARSALMSTPAVRASHVHIGEFQNITSPGMGGHGSGSGNGGGGFLSPLGGGGRAGGGGGGVGGGRGGGATAVLSTPLPNSSLGGSSSSSSSITAGGSSMLATLTGVGGRVHAINEPVAKLTEETAAAALALNNTQLAAECCCRLKASLEEEAEAVFSDAKELVKVRSSLVGLQDCANAFRRALDTGISSLAARLTPRLRSACNLFEGTSSLVQYELSEVGYASACAGDHAFSTEFLPVLAAMLAPYQYTLTPSLSRSLLLKVATYMAKQLEPRIRRKRFNLLGALQWEADARSLTGFFVARAGGAARDRFARLQALAHLLSCESRAEAEEVFKDGGVAALTREDLAAVLKLRVDL